MWSQYFPQNLIQECNFLNKYLTDWEAKVLIVFEKTTLHLNIAISTILVFKFEPTNSYHVIEWVIENEKKMSSYWF